MQISINELIISYIFFLLGHEGFSTFSVFLIYIRPFLFKKILPLKTNNVRKKIIFEKSYVR